MNALTGEVESAKKDLSGNSTYQALRRISPSDPVNLKTGRSDLRSLQLGVFGLGSDEDGI